jgi:hypothetical protein
MPAHSPLRGLSILSLMALAAGCAGGGTDDGGNSTGDLMIVMETNGFDIDPNGYELSIDAGAPIAIGSNAAQLFEDLTSGPHSLAIAGIAANCTLVGESPRSVPVVTDQRTDVTVVVNCTALDPVPARP